jgi:nitrite reductase/ring-hydroxylating ferredoxin subunit
VAQIERLICDSVALLEGGDGIRFEVQYRGEASPAFVIRYEGKARAYLNRCAHMPRELDWTPGQFFDMSKTLLVCSLHGALYHPDSGKCYLGPCLRGGLVALTVEEREGKVFVQDPVKN